MTELLIYQGKAALALVAFYIFYRLLLSKETFHCFNRIVLLGTAAMAFVLPLCVITISKTVILPAVSPVDTVVETVEGVITGTASVPQEPIWPAILLGIFVVGALAVMLMTVISIIKVRSNVRIATPPFDRAAGKWVDVNPGICSSYIYSLKPGDKITISGPYGEFFLPKDLPAGQELIFVGGGAGMAPMRSHIMHLFHTEKTNRKVNFFYGARALKEAFYLDDYHAIEKEFPNFKFNLALDRPDPEADAAGVPYVAGFVHNVMFETYLKNHEAPEDALYLMCGPPMMVGAVVNLLDSLGVPPENILYDNFGA